ncbi:MAG TPA: YetF domain-containing protein [Pseudoxanthomonas sp.]
MSDLFQMSAPWWVFVLRGIVIYVLVTVLMRISGKRAMAQVTPFDIILLILIGNTVQNGINGGDNSLTGALFMAGTLIALNWVVAWGSARSLRFRWLMEGAPTLLAENGVIDWPVLRRQLIGREDFVVAMRQAGCKSEKSIKRAILEPNGQIVIETTDDQWS